MPTLADLDRMNCDGDGSGSTDSSCRSTGTVSPTPSEKLAGLSAAYATGDLVSGEPILGDIVDLTLTRSIKLSEIVALVRENDDLKRRLELEEHIVADLPTVTSSVFKIDENNPLQIMYRHKDNIWRPIAKSDVREKSQRYLQFLQTISGLKYHMLRHLLELACDELEVE